MPGPVSAAVTDMVTAVDAALADDPLITDPARAVADLDELLALRTRVDALVVSRLRVADELDATSTLCGRATRSWLTEDHLMSGAAAARLCRLQKHLPFFQHVDAAFRAAAISTEHAAAVVTALLSLPPSLRPTLEPLLVAVAGEETPTGVTGMVDDLLSAVGFEKESDVRRERRYTQRGVDVTATSREHSALSGTLTAEVAEVLVLALRAAAEKCEADDRTPRQRMHDALGEIATFYLAHADVPQLDGERPRLTVCVRLEDLEERAAAGWEQQPLGVAPIDAARRASAWATLGSGARVSIETARRLCCDSGVMPVVLGGESQVLDLGRTHRHFSAATRRAAWIRDGGCCAFPRCRRKVVELHHIIWWSHGGRSDLDNAAWLCAYHHWLVHEGGWSLRRNADGGYTFSSPAGVERRRHLSAA